jgi:hypothetical protein
MLLFNELLPNARGIFLANGQNWGQGPTKEITKTNMAARVIEEAIRTKSVDRARA